MSTSTFIGRSAAAAVSAADAGRPAGAALACDGQPFSAQPRVWERVPCTQLGLLLGLLLFAAGSPPFLYGWLTTPADQVYTGLMFDVPDHAQYWSWVTASRDGLFIANTMTPEPNPPIFINPMMWTLAHVQQLTGLSFAALFQVWRLLGCAVLGIAIVMGFRRLVPDRPTRAAAYAMAIAGVGVGWIWVVIKHLQRAPDVAFPHDLYTVEPNTFFAAFAYPYLALAQGLVLLTFLGAWRVHREGGAAGYVIAVGSATALACTHAYDLITVYAVLGLYWLYEVLRTRRIPVSLTLVGIAIGIASGPIAVYYRNLTAGDPLWQALLAQYANAGVWTPPGLHLLVLMGLPLLLAAVALPAAFRSRGPDALMAIWAVAGLGLIYLPVVFQIKLLTAWQFPLAILAAHTWQARLAPWLSRRLPVLRPRQVALALLVLLVVPTNLYLFVWRFTELRRHERPYYLHRDELAALDWLAAHTTPQDVVIAPLELGQFVPNYGGTRTFLAHWAMTHRFFQRRAEADRFFDPETPEGYRQMLMERDGLTYVLFSPPRGAERLAASAFDSPLFEPVFESPHAIVYRYHHSALARARIDSPGLAR